MNHDDKNSGGDYLWDGTGPADAEVQRLERALGAYAHRGDPPPPPGPAPEPLRPSPRRRAFWPRLVLPIGVTAGIVGVFAGLARYAAASGGAGMLSVYIACLAFGGVLLVVSAFGGHDHDGGGADHGDTDGHGHEGEHHGTGDAALSAFAPFLSLRFYVFALAFFGLTGLVLQKVVEASSPGAVPVIAAAVGIAAGYGAARALRALAQSTVGTVADASSHVGRQGKLLLPVGPGQRGKVRINVGGADIDLPAELHGAAPLAAGEPVIVVEMRGTTAVVDGNPVEKEKKA